MVLRWQLLAKRYAFITWRGRARVYKRQRKARNAYVRRILAKRDLARLGSYFRAWKMIKVVEAGNALRPQLSQEDDKHGLLLETRERQHREAKVLLNQLQQVTDTNEYAQNQGQNYTEILRKIQKNIEQLDGEDIWSCIEHSINMAMWLVELLVQECTFAQQTYVYDPTRLLANHKLGSTFSDTMNRPRYYSKLLLKTNPQVII